jgi:hypothetical protein
LKSLRAPCRDKVEFGNIKVAAESWNLEMLTFHRVEEGMERALARFGDQETVDVKSFCAEIRNELEMLRREFEHKAEGNDFVSRQ